jgi:hypothetical protein
MTTRQFNIHMPERALGLIAEAAQESGCKASTWARQTLYAALRASGRDPTAMPANGMADRDSWALVDDANDAQQVSKNEVAA